MPKARAAPHRAGPWEAQIDDGKVRRTVPDGTQRAGASLSEKLRPDPLTIEDILPEAGPRRGAGQRRPGSRLAPARRAAFRLGEGDPMLLPPDDARPRESSWPSGNGHSRAVGVVLFFPDVGASFLRVRSFPVVCQSRWCLPPAGASAGGRGTGMSPRQRRRNFRLACCT